MNIELLLLSIIFIIIGLVIMITNKFYNYKTSDMLFAVNLRIFIGGLIFFLMGVYGIINEFLINIF